MQKDSIEALHQNRNPLVQEAGFPSLARAFGDPPSKVILLLLNRSLIRVTWDSNSRWENTVQNTHVYVSECDVRTTVTIWRPTW